MVEGAETLTVSGATHLTVDPATVTINDNDATPTKVILSVNPDTVDEDDASTPVMVTGTLDGAASTTPTVVSVSVGAGSDSATEGTDYTTVTDFTLTIAANQMKGTATFDLAPTDDESAEGAETVTVSGSTGGGLPVDSATVTIIDDDRASKKVTLSAAPSEVSEDAGATAVTVTGRLDGAVLDTATTVTVSVSGGTATAGEDFAAVSDFPLHRVGFGRPDRHGDREDEGDAGQ